MESLRVILGILNGKEWEKFGYTSLENLFGGRDCRGI
jgi:hypothetical protein